MSPMIKHYGTQKKMNDIKKIQNLQLDKLLGSKYTFPDGDYIKVIEIKLRDKQIEGKGEDGIAPFITYEIRQGPGIPRRLTMFHQEFIDTYGHLFSVELGREE